MCRAVKGVIIDKAVAFMGCYMVKSCLLCQEYIFVHPSKTLRKLFTANSILGLVFLAITTTVFTPPKKKILRGKCLMLYYQTTKTIIAVGSPLVKKGVEKILIAFHSPFIP